MYSAVRLALCLVTGVPEENECSFFIVPNAARVKTRC
jgi:hypothetical protein